jgi:predicted nucleic acid-binding protein
MTFDAIPHGAAIFIDANVLVYKFSNHPAFAAPCNHLLQRIENGELSGYVAAAGVSDMAHRLMAMEAGTLFGWPNQGIARRLRSHPTQVQQLALYRQAIDDLALFGLQILPIDGSLVSLAADVTRQYGLLSGDALVVTVMRAHNLTLLASHDADFDRVPGITRYSPA